MSIVEYIYDSLNIYMNIVEYIYDSLNFATNNQP